MCVSARACVCVCLHSFALMRAINIHTWWIRMGWSSELCRALTESSFEMYIQCEGLKWFLLNSIFYRFCRHFVVGRKKNKINFMGACLPRYSVTHRNSFSIIHSFYKYIKIIIHNRLRSALSVMNHEMQVNDRSPFFIKHYILHIFRKRISILCTNL